MELREKIARAIFFRGGEEDDTHWKHVQSWHRDVAYEQADAILALPEIKEALGWHGRWMLHPTGETLETEADIDAFFARVRDKTERMEFERLKAKFAA